MRNDKELPFGRGIYQFIIDDSGSAQAFRYFIVATRAARKSFDDAFNVANCKAQAEAHEYISDAVAASKSFSDKDSMIKKGYTPNDFKKNPTFNTNNPNHFKPPMHLKISVKI